MAARETAQRIADITQDMANASQSVIEHYWTEAAPDNSEPHVSDSEIPF